MASFGITEEYGSLMTLSNIITDSDYITYVKDIIEPYTTNVRDTYGFNTTRPLQEAFDMTYQSFIKETRVGIMASHVAMNAHAKPRGTKPAKVTEGTMPHIAANRTLGKEDYLRIGQDISRNMRVDKELDLATGTQLALRDEVYNGMLAEHANRATYMRGQVASRAKYEITEKNNDGSFTNVEFQFAVPTANRILTSWWDDADRKIETEGSDVVKSLREFVYLATKGYKSKALYELEVDYQTMQDTVTHSSVRRYIGMQINPLVPEDQRAGLTIGFDEDQLRDALTKLTGVKIVPSRYIVGLEVLNKKTGQLEDKDLKCFEENVFLLRKSGNMGEIYSTKQLTVGGGAGSNGLYMPFEGGRIMMTYTCDVRHKIQIWDTEETTMYALNNPQDLFYLTVAPAAKK